MRLTKTNYIDAGLEDSVAHRYDDMAASHALFYDLATVPTFYLDYWLGDQMVVFLDRQVDFIQSIDADLGMSRDFRDEGRTKWTSEHAKFQIVNAKCDQVPDDSDVRDPCDVLLDQADLVEADATGDKVFMDNKHSAIVVVGVDFLKEHFTALVTYHRALKDRVEDIRQIMLTLLQEAKDRHAAILANPFPDRDYDGAFSWAV